MNFFPDKSNSSSTAVINNKPTWSSHVLLHRHRTPSSSLSVGFFKLVYSHCNACLMVKYIPKATVTWTHSICNFFYFRTALWNQLNQRFLYSAIKLPIKLIRKKCYHYCELHKQPHGRILNMSLCNFTRKNEFQVDVKVDLEEFFLPSPTPKKNFLLLIYPQWFQIGLWGQFCSKISCSIIPGHA